MSTKKDKFSLKDKFYMEIALKLANSRLGLTGSNPSVGCVIVKNDKIISIGQTSYNGRPHAEFNAIKNCIDEVKWFKDVCYFGTMLSPWVNTTMYRYNY